MQNTTENIFKSHEMKLCHCHILQKFLAQQVITFPQIYDVQPDVPNEEKLTGTRIIK